MAGKGSSPRNNHSKKFRDNYSSIDWGKKRKEKCDLCFVESKKLIYRSLAFNVCKKCNNLLDSPD